MLSTKETALSAPAVTGLVLGSLLPGSLSAGDAPAQLSPHEAGPRNWLGQEIQRFRSFPHLDRGYRLLQAGKMQAARHEFAKYLRLQPGDSQVRLLYMGLLHKHRAPFTLRKQATILLSQQPNHVQALIFRAQAQDMLGQVKLALADYNRAAVLSPRGSSKRDWALRQAADLAQRHHKPQASLTALMLLAEERPGDTELALRQSLLQLQLGQSLEAEQTLRQALALSTSPAQQQQLRLGLIDISKARQDWPAARTQALAALKQDPNNPELQAILADIAYAQREYPTAIRWLSKSVQARSNSQRREFLANLLAQQGRHEEAARHYQALLTPELSARSRYRLLTNLGLAQLGLGQPKAATQTFAKAERLRPSSQGLGRLVDSLEQSGQLKAATQALVQAPAQIMTPELYYREALLRLRQGQKASAERPLELALQGKLPAQLRPQAQRQLAYILADQGRYDRARRLQQQALLQDPNNLAAIVDLAQTCLKAGDRGCAISQWQAALQQPSSESHRQRSNLLVQLGLVLYQEGRWQDAANRFEQALALHNDVQTRLYLGHTYIQLRKPAVALQHLEVGLKSKQARSPEQRKRIWLEIAHLHETQKDVAAAARAYRAALALQSDAQTRMRLGQLQLRSGDLEGALASLTLKTGEPQPLTPEQEAERQDSLTQVYRQLGRPGAALAASINAQQLAPTPSRSYQVGMEYLAQQEVKDAIPWLEASVAQAPKHKPYQESLAYAYHRAGDHLKAARLLENVAKQSPQPGRLYADIGYMKLQGGEKEEGRDWLLKAANTELAQFGSADLNLRQDILQLEQADQRQENGWQFSLYQSYRSGEDAPSAGSQSGVLPTQGGAELAYTPAAFRQQHSLQLFSRLLWASEHESISPEKESLQGDVGLRYKPLAEHNLWLGAEGLIKLGDDSQDDWLLRASYGWTQGYAPQPGREHWNYSFLYTDLGYFTRDDTWAYYGEARQGRSFRLGDRLIMTPHVVVNGLGQNPDPDQAAYLEAGAGVSTRLLFGNLQQHSAELLLHYKHGIGDDSGDKFMATFSLQF